MAETRQARIKEQFKVLQEQLDAAQRDWAGADTSDRVRYGRKIRDLEADQDKLDEELRQLERQTSHSARQEHFDSNFSKIDFRFVEKIEKHLRKNMVEGSAVALVVQKSHEMGGDFLAKRIREMLSGIGGNLKHWPVLFHASTANDLSYLLGQLCGHLHPSDEPVPLDNLSSHVIERMCQSLVNGSILFLELTSWNRARPADQMLSWFLDVFWKEMVEKWNSLRAHRPGIKFFALLRVDEKLSKVCSADARIKNPDTYAHGKLYCHTLRPFKREELRAWLINWGGYETGSDVNKVVEDVHEISRGKGSSVHHLLSKELLK